MVFTRDKTVRNPLIRAFNKSANASNLIMQTLLSLSDDYMWSKNIWVC